MPDLTLANLPILVALIVPGFLWFEVHHYLQISRPGTERSWLGMFTLSAISYAVWSWWIPRLWIATAATIDLVSRSNSSDDVDWNKAIGDRPLFGWFIVTFISPVVLGVITGFAQRRGWWRGFLIRTLRLNIPHPVETAWEWVFSQGTWLWATVTLTDGSDVEGIFGDKSMASSNSDRQDLYLQRYFVKDGGQLVPIDNDAGIWISAPMIKAISFRSLTAKESNS